MVLGRGFRVQGLGVPEIRVTLKGGFRGYRVI